MNKNNLRNMLSERASELDYTFERFINGSTEYLVYPYERGRVLEGPGMRYRFNEKGEAR